MRPEQFARFLQASFARFRIVATASLWGRDFDQARLPSADHASRNGAGFEHECRLFPVWLSLWASVTIIETSGHRCPEVPQSSQKRSSGIYAIWQACGGYDVASKDRLGE
jgi:hypothetical protein